MRIAHALDVTHQILRQLAITESFAVRTAQPAFQMNLVDGNRFAQPVFRGTRFHPGGVAPLVLIQVGYDGSGLRRRLAIERIRVSLELAVAVKARAHVVFVRTTFTGARQKEFPDTAIAET